MFEGYKIAVTISLVNHVSSALSGMSKDFKVTEKDAAALQKRIESIKLGLKGGLLSAGAGIAIASMFKPAIQDAMQFERAILRLKDIGGIDLKIVSQVRANALSGKYQGIGATESVDLFRDLHAAFGDAKDAMQFMPMFTTLARVTQGKYGKSAVAGEEDVRAIAKIAERRGGTKSPQAMGHAMDLVMKIQNASGGAVTPKDMLAFVTQMGAMGNLMSDNGILQYWALIQEQGGSKAGTALNSGLQNLVNGRGTEGSGSVLRKIGWVDEKLNAAHLKSLYGDHWSSHLNKVTADSVKDFGLAKSAPIQWMMQDGLPLINAYLDKIGVKDPKVRESETISLMAQAFSNRKGADSYALIATQLPRILKDFNIGLNSAGMSDSAKSFDDSPMAKFQKLSADYQTALINLGISALPVLIPMVNRLERAFKNFNQFAEKNPAKIKLIADGLLALSAALVGFGTLTIIANGIKAIGLAFSFASVGGTAGLTALGAVLGPIGLGLAAIAAAVAGMMWVLDWAKTSNVDPKNHPGMRRHSTGHGSKWVVDPTLSQEHAGQHWEALPHAGGKWVNNIDTVKPRGDVNGRMINNTIVMPDGKVLAKVVTHEMVKGMSQPLRGQTTVDMSMSPVPVGMKVQR